MPLSADFLQRLMAALLAAGRPDLAVAYFDRLAKVPPGPAAASAAPAAPAAGGPEAAGAGGMEAAGANEGGVEAVAGGGAGGGVEASLGCWTVLITCLARAGNLPRAAAVSCTPTHRNPALGEAATLAGCPAV